jgi:hypothetical protein
MNLRTKLLGKAIMINFEFKCTNLLEISMPKSKESFKTRLFPRGNPVFVRKHDVILLDATATSMYNSISTYHVDICYPEPMKALSK